MLIRFIFPTALISIIFAWFSWLNIFGCFFEFQNNCACFFPWSTISNSTVCQNSKQLTSAQISVYTMQCMHMHAYNIHTEVGPFEFSISLSFSPCEFACERVSIVCIHMWHAEFALGYVALALRFTPHNILSHQPQHSTHSHFDALFFH